MRLFFTIFWIILVFLILGLFSLNVGQHVQIDLFFSEYKDVDLITVAFSTLFIGFVFGALLLSYYLIRLKKEQNLLKKQINFLQSEIRKIESGPELIDAEVIDNEEDNETEEDEKDNKK